MASAAAAEACATLGLAPGEGDQDIIRKAYLKKSLRYHPDKAVRNGLSEEEATALFQQIALAFGTLGGDNGTVDLPVYGPMTRWEWESCLGHLPAHALSAICEHLSLWRDVFRMRRCCRRLAALFVPSSASAEFDLATSLAPKHARRAGCGMHALNLRKCPARDLHLDPHLQGLQHCVRLQKLDLGMTDVRDIAALGRCPSLVSLRCSDCYRLEDVSGLVQRGSKLAFLDLSGCSVGPDVSYLGDAPSLLEVDLSGCKSVQDVSGLGRSRTIRTLRLSGCKLLTDITGLGDCASLEALHLENTRVADVSAFVARARAAAALDVQARQAGDEIHHLDAPEDLAENADAHARGNGTGVNLGCSQLRKLDLRLTGVSDVSCLVLLPALESLDLSWTKVQCVQALADCPALKSLDLEHTAVNDVSALGECVRLHTLRLRGAAGIRDVSGLHGCSSLKKLFVKQKEIRGVAELAARGVDMHFLVRT